MTRWNSILVAFVLLSPFSQADQADDERNAHLGTLQKQVDDLSLETPRRERLALEMAATLDRAAQSAATAEARRARWGEAVRVLDRFNERNPDHTQLLQFQFQAAVYVWAEARSWVRQVDLAPTDTNALDRAIEGLDEAVARLGRLSESLRGATDVFVQNIHFRLAQALADRSRFDPKGSPRRRTREEQALALLGPAFTEPSLQGFANLLRAELFDRLGQGEKALAAIDAAARAKPAPPPAELLAARVDALVALKRFDDALRAIEQAPRPAEAVKDALAIRLRLAERATLPKGEARIKVETDLFRRLTKLRASGKAEARASLIEVARELSEPDAGLGADAWEGVAEGALLLGEVTRASALENRAADLHAASGQGDQASSLRLRSGALLYQAARYREADALLSRIVDDPKAGPARARAGQLRILTRGRALALRLPWATQASYIAALESQIRDFPKEPATGEACWLLGKLRLATGDRGAAKSLWSAIPPGASHWLDARLAIAEFLQEDLDTQRINNDRTLVTERYNEARAFLTTSRDRATNPADQMELSLALARLDLTPGAGRPDEARLTCERVQKTSTQADQRDRARRLHLLALAESSRFVEAEQAARVEVRQSRAVDLLELARLVDHVASEQESDLRMRRFGLILRILLDSVLEQARDLTPDQLAEARLRMTRSLVFRGDDDAARRSLSLWPAPPASTDDRWLKDLADAYTRLDASNLAIDVHRLRAQRARSGSLPWFEARYGLALAYSRSGKAESARRLIDATSILHPELGGGELRDKFIRLRQRLGPEN